MTFSRTQIWPQHDIMIMDITMPDDGVEPMCLAVAQYGAAVDELRELFKDVTTYAPALFGIRKGTRWPCPLH